MPRSIKKLGAAISIAKNRQQKAIAYYNLGLFHDNNAREAEAIPNYEMALRLGLGKDSKSKALAWLASSLYKTGKLAEALKRVEQSQRIASHDLLGFLNGLKKRIEKSIRSRK
ncbi:MAG: Tetratrico peptide repeat [Candidatus Parcubacteria bacterium]|jgi:tetratricopeptide (TPR) repeat protein